MINCFRHPALIRILVSCTLLTAPICVNAMKDCEWQLNIPGAKSGVSEKAEWLARTFANRAPSFGRADTFAQTILKKSKKEKAEWLQAIASAYPIVSKDRPGPPPTHAIVKDKRILDRLLLWIEGDSRKMKELIEVMSVKDAFREIIANRIATFKTLCSETDLELVASRFQATLRSLENARTSGPSTSILIGGSFINGKWQTGSDIDVSVSNAASAKILVQALTAQVKDGLSPECTPKISISIEPAAFYGRLNPFALEINLDSYRLHVFEPTSQGNDLTPNMSREFIYDWVDTTMN